jgi:ABC-2 type transport system ATP-binding protein
MAGEPTRGYSGGPIIDVRDLCKAYGGHVVVDDVDLQVASGEVLGLLGPNGAGKTTLIKILCGLLVPDRGSGTVLGFDLVRHPAAVRARVSLVAPTADVGLDNNLTVRQNLDFWALVYGLRGREKAKRIDAVLDVVELTKAQAAWPMHISAGMRQRLAIARALLAENRLLFLDEPTIKLDVEGARHIRQFIQEVNQRSGLTVLITTHLMFEAEELCRRILVMDRGHIVAAGTPAELKSLVGRDGQVEAAVADLELGSLEDLGYPWEYVDASDSSAGVWVRLTIAAVEAETARLLDRVPALGGQIRSLRTRDVTLEDVFFHLTGRGLDGQELSGRKFD